MALTYLSVYNILLEKFGYQNWWPVIEKEGAIYLDEYRERKRSRGEILEIMTGAILTQNTAWYNAARAVAGLKRKGMMSLEALLSAGLSEIAGVIREAGFHNQKAKKIRALTGFIMNELKGDVSALNKYPLPEARKKL